MLNPHRVLSSPVKMVLAFPPHTQLWLTILHPFVVLLKICFKHLHLFVILLKLWFDNLHTVLFFSNVCSSFYKYGVIGKSSRDMLSEGVQLFVMFLEIRFGKIEANKKGVLRGRWTK
jgi:hypothetical protein